MRDYFAGMIKNDLYKATCSSLLLLAVLFSDAQQKTKVKATVDRNNILIGEQIQLTLEADIPENELIHFFIIDSLPHFEVLNNPKIDTTNTREGTVLKQIITITSFDSGHWVIPSFALEDNIVTDTLPVDVGFTALDPAQDYHDIKDIIEVKPEQEKEKWWLWYAIGGGALLLVILLIYLLSRKKPVVQAPVIVIDPYEEAITQLERLQQEKPDQKQYYSRLVDIFRVYIYHKKGIHSLQKTTDDLVVQLKGIPIAREQFEKLSQSLRLSDLVKFAKYIPGDEDDRNAFETIKRTIGEIEQIK